MTVCVYAYKCGGLDRCMCVCVCVCVQVSVRIFTPHVCICDQLWVISHAHVRQLARTRMEVKHHLEKVRVRCED